MLSAALFLLTAGATGRQLFLIQMWGVWGRKSHPVELVALLGAAFLALGAVVTLADRRVGSVIAIISCVALWAFYALALVTTATMLTSGQYRLEPGGWFELVPPLLLLMASVVAPVVALRKSGSASS